MTLLSALARRIIFEPNRAFGDRDSYDRAGMWLSVAADARNWEVTDVLAGGPAYRAGLRIGDKVQYLTLDRTYWT